jgi:hypothetical protein
LDFESKEKEWDGRKEKDMIFVSLQEREPVFLTNVDSQSRISAGWIRVGRS